MTIQTGELSGSQSWGRDKVPFWFAVHTRSRYEKKVFSYLVGKEIEAFLPMYPSVRRWSDRRKQLMLPLFSGYLFVRFLWTPENRLQVLKTPGVVRIIGDDDNPLPIPEEQIFAVQRMLAGRMDLQPYPYMDLGQRVEIRHGCLKGLRGILVRKKNSLRFVISVDMIRQSVAIEIGVEDLEPLPSS
jgi:transcription antitermination factor NusG